MIKFIAYFNEHRYCAHRKNTGMRLVRMKKPTKSICGTNNSGANSVTLFTSPTLQPIHTATEQEHIPNPHAAKTMRMKLPCIPTKKYVKMKASNV